jgi:broad specificity phosphatase PhoE
VQYLLLARHGNTFAPGQTAVWVGARNDLPLVDSGIEQAQSLAKALEKALIKPEIVYAATLQRTVNYAQIIHDRLQLSKAVILDHRLDEIDYGSWSGLSNDEIKSKFGGTELDQWNEHGKWPRSFPGLESVIEGQVKSFVQEVIETQANKKMTLAVTSNGRLKYFLKLIPDIYSQYIEKSQWKVATGNICLLSYSKGLWDLICWNESPQLMDIFAARILVDKE